jgi:hypothetical protein
MRRARDVEPLQLFAIVVSFAIVAAGVAGWFQAGSDPRGIFLWALACALAFEWILLPLAWLLDRIAFGPRTLRPAQAAPATAPVVPPANRAYLRVPALLSALLLIVFAPLIFRADTPTFAATTGLAPPDYLTRWLLATAAMFAVSALAYAVSLRRRRISGR